MISSYYDGGMPDVYFTWYDEKLHLLGDIVYDKDGKTVEVSNHTKRRIKNFEYISYDFRYYTDGTYSKEIELFAEICYCTPWQLLHGNPECSVHGRKL